MSTPYVLERYLAWIEARLPEGLAPEERQRRVDSLRQRLADDAAAIQAAQPELDPDEAALRALNALPAPLEAVPVDAPRASRLHRVAELGVRGKESVDAAAARNVRPLILLGSVALAVVLLLLVSAAGLGPAAPRPAPTPQDPSPGGPKALFTRDDALTAAVTSQTDAFTVPAGATGRLNLSLEGEYGCVDVVLRDPAGHAALRRTRACPAITTNVALEAPGTWHLEYEFMAWTGRLRVAVLQV